MANYLYEVTVNKYNTTELVKKVHLVASNIHQACGVAEYYIMEEGMFPNTPIEIAGIVRFPGIEDVVNASMDEIDIDEEELGDPFDIEGIPDDDLIIFKHTPCNNTVKVLDNGWGNIKCPCGEEILRNEVQNISGIWCYVPTANKRNRKK